MSENLPTAEIVQYPLLPLRDVVVFPHMVIPLFVGRPKSIKAMETAMEAGKSILLVAQKSAAKDDPGPGPLDVEIEAVSPLRQQRTGGEDDHLCVDARSGRERHRDKASVLDDEAGDFIADHLDAARA